MIVNIEKIAKSLFHLYETHNDKLSKFLVKHVSVIKEDNDLTLYVEYLKEQAIKEENYEFLNILQKLNI